MKLEKLREYIRVSKVRNHEFLMMLNNHQSRMNWYNRLTGRTDWRLVELIRVCRACGLTKEQFLDLVEYDSEEYAYNKEVNL